MKVSNADLAYIAGFFDGEGCIFIDQNNHSYTLEVTITQNKNSPLQWIQEKYRGSLRQQNHDSWTGPKWIWKLRNNQALEFLRDILPYLIVKNHQASVAIDYQTNKFSSPGKAILEDELARRSSYKQLISSLSNVRRNDRNPLPVGSPAEETTY